jgi:Cof subfamily protein (haloacid dehalogenase superfamily)
MNYKVIFIDVDGTLFDHINGEVPASAIKAIKIAKSKGIKVVLNTGRSLALIKELGVDKLIDADAYITCNGAITYNKKEEIINAFPFNTKEIMPIIHELTARHIRLLIVPKGLNYINMELTNEAKGAFDDLRIKYPKIRSITEESIYQLVLFGSPEQAKEVAPLLRGLTFKQFHPNAYDVFAPGVHKGTAIKSYLAKNKIKKSEAVALGDGHNDYEMMLSVKHSVAMGNANEDIKKAAQYETTAVNENGLYEAFKMLGIV